MEWKRGMKVMCVKKYDGFKLGEVHELTNRYCNRGWMTKTSVFWYIGDRDKQYWEVVDMKFTRDDLKVGMVVGIRGKGCRGSNLYIVMNSKNGMCINDEYGEFMVLKDYQEDLKLYKGEKDDFDIMKVYDLSELAFKANRVSIEDRELLWERHEETKELTMEDLERDYGCRVKIVKE